MYFQSNEMFEKNLKSIFAKWFEINRPVTMKFEIEKLPGKMELPGHGQQQSISRGKMESPYAIYKNRLAKMITLT